MLARQRHRVIMEMLQTQQSLRTIELAKYFGVTDETIRRDLEQLDAEGKLLRTHGGAVGIERRGEDLPLQKRLKENREAKLAIAKKAVSFVRPSETILLDASSTVLALAEIMPDFNLTVITNSHDCVAALSAKKNVRVVSTGGLYDPVSRSFGGAMAWNVLRKFAVDKIFFSCNGIDLERGASEAVDFHAEFKENALPFCAKKILMCDSSKFGLRSTRYFASMEDIDLLITEDTASPFVEKLGGKVEVL